MPQTTRPKRSNHCPPALRLPPKSVRVYPFSRHLGFGSGGEKQMEAEIRELLGLDPFQGTETTTTASRWTQ